MGFFSRRPQPLFPQNTAALLAEYGRQQFDRRTYPDVSPATDELILSLTTSSDIRERRPEAIETIKQIGLSADGWSVYGAWDVLYANFLDPVPEEVLEELIEPRVRFLHTLNHPQLKMHLSTPDILEYQRLFPAAFAQMYPDWDTA